MAQDRPTFDTRAEAEAYCRKREGKKADGLWMPFEAGGRWTAVRTNLPRSEDPTGTETAAKPKPPTPGDPYSPQQRELHYGAGGG